MTLNEEDEGVVSWVDICSDNTTIIMKERIGASLTSRNTIVLESGRLGLKGNHLNQEDDTESE